MSPLLQQILIGVICVIVAPLVAAMLGWLLGIMQASREASFRRRALKLYRRDGQIEEFLILSGEPALVQHLFQIVVATSIKASEIAVETAKRNEGIKINDDNEENDEQDTN